MSYQQQIVGGILFGSSCILRHRLENCVTTRAQVTAVYAKNYSSRLI